MNELKELLPFIIPLVIAELALLAYTIRHILTHTNYKRGSRTLWLVIASVGMEFIGPVLYFLLGKYVGTLGFMALSCLFLAVASVILRWWIKTKGARIFAAL